MKGGERGLGLEKRGCLLCLHRGPVSGAMSGEARRMGRAGDKMERFECQTQDYGVP